LTLIDTDFDDSGTNRVVHQVWGLRESDYESISQEKNGQVELGSDIDFPGGVPREITFRDGSTIESGVIDPSTGVYRKVFVIQDGGSLELHQEFEVSSGCRVRRAEGANREILELRGNTGFADGAAVNIYGANDSIEPNEFAIFCQNTNAAADFRVDSNGLIIAVTMPTSDPLVNGALWNNSGVVTVS
jgi:hypothetical protein